MQFYNFINKYILRYCCLPAIIALVFFLFSLSIQAQIRIGLWEPEIYLPKDIKSSFRNPKEKFNGIDDDKNGIIDDLYGVVFNEAGQLAGKAIIKYDSTKHNLYQHGWALYQVLKKSIPRFKIVQAGFTPLTQQLEETSILALSVSERKTNLPKEYEFYKNFAVQTVGYFAKQKVQVVNMSFGTSAEIFAENNLNLGTTDEERKTAAKKWMENFLQSFAVAFSSAPNILFIVAAGNDGNDMEAAFDVPGLADLPNVICVGALNQKCQPADFSNTGKRIDVWASGENISIKDNNGNQQTLSGTSLAVPIITAAAANLLKKNKKLPASAVKQQLINLYKKNPSIFCKK